MKNLKLITLLILILYAFNSSADVKPRYKAHLNIISMVHNGDSLIKKGFNVFEISYFEESEMITLAKGEDGEIGIKFFGRPVWRNGNVIHDFMIEFYFKKMTSDKWNYLTKSRLNDWKTPVKPEFFKLKKMEQSVSCNYGKIAFAYNTYIELLEPDYAVEKDSSFLPQVELKIKKMKIEGEKVKLKKKNFEEKYRTKGVIAVGKLKKHNVNIEYHINMGSAKDINDIEVVLFYSYFDKKTQTEEKKKMATVLIDNMTDKTNGGLLSIYEDGGREEFSINYTVKAFKLL